MQAGRKYIPMFVQLEADTNVPAQYLYALARRESRFCPTKIAHVRGCPKNPTDAQVRQRAVGLFQLTKKVVTGYNEAHETAHTKRDMLDAALNARVAAWYLERRIVKRFAHDWRSARDVAIITQAWNSGPGGTRRVLDSLPVTSTVDDIKRAAQRILARGEEFSGLAAKAYRHIANRKTGWAKGVASDTLKNFGDPSFTEPQKAAWSLGRIYSWLLRWWPFHF